MTVDDFLRSVIVALEKQADETGKAGRRNT